MKNIITSKPDTFTQYLKKVWQHRALIMVFARRDLKIKYAQTWLGLGWTVVQPLTAVCVYTLFFFVLLDVKASYPYVLFVMSGVLIWNLFNYIFSHASTSLINSQDLIKKMCFPKIILPLSKAVTALFEFIITIVLLIPMMFYFNTGFRFTLFLIPFIVLIVMLFSLGLSFILSTLTIRNRDLFHIIPFMINFGIWFTPVFYPVSIIPPQFAHYKNIIFINPLSASIQLFRWSFFGEPLNLFVAVGLFISLIIFIIGFLFFKNAEDKIIDLI